MTKYYIIDAFADKLYTGNPAGVCLLDAWLPDDVMQSVAAENNLAETAFVVRQGEAYGLRGFTPGVEIDLCGHATLASAYALYNFTADKPERVRFETKSGVLTVTKRDELYELDFPARMPSKIDATPQMAEAVGAKVLEAHMSRDMLLLLESELHVRELRPNLDLVGKIPGCFAVIVTAKGDEADFVSRFFAPSAGIPEDPVTGSAHSTLIPFWSERLGKTRMLARQLSKRGGTLHCEHSGERVKISGKAALYLQGELNI